jgi:hypothetical protein
VITAERHVHTDSERLWGLVSQVSRWAELLPTVDDVTPKTGGESPSVGARYALKQPGLPVLVYEITDWRPGEAFTWVATSPGVRTVGTHEVGPAPEGCTLRLGLHWEGPLTPLVERLFGRRTEGFVQQEADTFAGLAEQLARS